MSKKITHKHLVCKNLFFVFTFFLRNKSYQSLVVEVMSIKESKKEKHVKELFRSILAIVLSDEKGSRRKQKKTCCCC